MGRLERMDLSRQGASADNRPAVRKRWVSDSARHTVEGPGWWMGSSRLGNLTWKLCAVVFEQ